jgi:hypothetical protein
VYTCTSKRQEIFVIYILYYILDLDFIGRNE